MLEDNKVEIIDRAKGIAKFFELSITLKLFGQIVWSWTFSPKN